MGKLIGKKSKKTRKPTILKPSGSVRNFPRIMHDATHQTWVAACIPMVPPPNCICCVTGIGVVPPPVGAAAAAAAIVAAAEAFAFTLALAFTFMFTLEIAAASPLLDVGRDLFISPSPSSSQVGL